MFIIQDKGFSLIEQILVLILISTIIAFAIPSYKTFTNKANNQVLSSQLLHAISLARSEAILHSNLITLCKSHNQTTCGGNWEEGFIVLSPEKILFKFQANQEGALHWRGFPKTIQAIQFLPSGLANSTNGTFWYCEKNATNPSWAIVVNLSGRARLTHPDESLVC